METIRFVCVIAVFLIGSQYGADCFQASFGFPFFGLNLVNQDREVTGRLSRIIANARTAATNYRSQANGFNRQIDDASNRFFLNISSNVTDTVIEIHKPCEELLQRALNASEAVSECASEQIDAIESAINNTLSTLAQCKANKIAEGLTIVEYILSNSSNATTLTQNTIQGLSNCIRIAGNSFLGFISPAVIRCKLNLAFGAGQAYTSLTARLASLVVQAKAYLLTLKIDLAACGILAAAQAASSAAGIAADIASCFANSTTSG